MDRNTSIHSISTGHILIHRIYFTGHIHTDLFPKSSVHAVHCGRVSTPNRPNGRCMASQPSPSWFLEVGPHGLAARAAHGTLESRGSLRAAALHDAGGAWRHARTPTAPADAVIRRRPPACAHNYLGPPQRPNRPRRRPSQQRSAAVVL
jgi:hypothetical protein